MKSHNRTKLLATVVGMMFGVVVTASLMACQPSTGAKDPHLIPIPDDVREGIMTGVEVGDSICAIIAASTGQKDVQKFCATVDQWAPVVEQVIKFQKAKGAKLPPACMPEPSQSTVDGGAK